MKIKEIVRLREKPLKDGQKSLYLDIYVNGTRSYEFLKLYLQPETSKIAKEKNKQTLLLADAIKAKRIVEIQTGEFRALKNNKVTLMSLIESRLARKDSVIDKYLSKILRVYLKDKDIELSKITPKWVERFFDFLEHEFKSFIKKTPLKASSARLLGNRLSGALAEAVKMDIIKDNPCQKVRAIKAQESQRTYLTQEELKRLASTPYERGERVTKAFLFSCLTGLRFSDVSKLRWAEVSEDFKRITFVQKKNLGA